jgi:electron transfer flavoprotein alpha subunit
VAALIKQVPMVDSLTLDERGHLRRDDVLLEMNPYCRRAVSKGVELARESGGSCTVVTMGPPAAEDVLREAVAWGADRGVHLCDAAFAGSDTLATARALAAALHLLGPFDLVLVGRNSIDGDTGQVGPEVAQMIGLAFASGVRRLDLEGRTLRLQLELDDGADEVQLEMPAVLSVAERLCEPCKVDDEGRRGVPADRIERLRARDLGEGPWGEEGSPTRVGTVRHHEHDRDRIQLSGPVESQVAEAVRLLDARGALDHRSAERGADEGFPGPTATGGAPPAGDGRHAAATRHPPAGDVAVLLEPGRPQVAAELLHAARTLADQIGAEVVAIVPGKALAALPEGAPPPHGDGRDVAGALGADELVVLGGVRAPDDVAQAFASWAARRRPWGVLAPSTAFGREVAGRAAAALDAGLVGDAIGLEVVAGRLVAAKPAFSGSLVADITCLSPIQMATIRPGVLPLGPRRQKVARRVDEPAEARERVTVLSSRRDDDVEVLARADVVIGVGTGVAPDEYDRLSALAVILGAEMAATRKVTDRGWAPRSRQVGITGRHIAPRLYVGIGLSGKFNHMVGVRSAGTVLVVNADPAAPAFEHSDIGIVADWHEVLPLLEEELRVHRRASPVASAPGWTS